MSFRIYPYRTGSKSVRKLKEELDAKIIKLEGSRYRQRPDHTVINWGNSRTPDWLTSPMLNQPDAVKLAANKHDAFETLEENDVSTVPFTSDVDVAQDWLENGSKVFVRHSLTGHSGDGIEVIKQPSNLPRLRAIAEELSSLGMPHYGNSIVNSALEQTQSLPDAPLYTCAVANSGEYRVHVVEGEVILYQKKSRRVDEDGNVATPEGAEADVRNLASNWVYRTGNLRRLERVENLAIDAIDAMGLDFGAVDIIMDNNGDVHVLEINTAPGLGNTDTLQAYADAFNKVIE